jgi:hypothetical protein
LNTTKTVNGFTPGEVYPKQQKMCSCQPTTGKFFLRRAKKRRRKTLSENERKKSRKNIEK